MNLYLIVFLLLFAGSIWECLHPQHEEKLYLACWAVLTALLCLRFGQGTDYVTYHAIYESIPVVIDLSQKYVCGVSPEIGWRLLSALFKVFHMPFWGFTAALGLTEMLLLHRFLKKYVPLKVTGLFLSYPVLFTVYMVSGLRQGLAICIFLGLALPFYLEKRWLPYVAIVLLASSFHRVGYAWLALAPIAYLPMRAVLSLAGLSLAGGLLLQLGAVEQMIVELFPAYHVKQFLLEGDMSLFALGERLLSLLALTALYAVRRRDRALENQEQEQIMKAYVCGVCFYMLLFGNAYYASRYGAIFKVLECVPVVWILCKGNSWKGIHDKTGSAAAVFFLGLAFVMGIKNLNASIHESGYDKIGVNLLNYSYVSVLWPDKINDYYDYSECLDTMYTYNMEDQELWRLEE